MTCISCNHSFMTMGEVNPDLKCRRNPPTAAVLPVPTTQGLSVRVLSVWPIVQRTDRCSRFESAPTVN